MVKKISAFSYWIFGISTNLTSPVNNNSLQLDIKNPLGAEYIFSLRKVSFIKSPINGKVLKIFHGGKTISIVNSCGLQVILTINFSDENQVGSFSFPIKEGSQIKESQIIFELKILDNEGNVTVYIPWQPKIIKKIEGMKIFYRNPWSKLKTKLYGEYI